MVSSYYFTDNLLVVKGKFIFTLEQNGSFQINQMIQAGIRNRGPADLSAFWWDAVWNPRHLDAFLLRMFNLKRIKHLTLTSNLKEIQG